MSLIALCFSLSTFNKHDQYVEYDVEMPLDFKMTCNCIFIICYKEIVKAVVFF
jgi:hypothetical protein